MSRTRYGGAVLVASLLGCGLIAGLKDRGLATSEDGEPDGVVPQVRTDSGTRPGDAESSPVNSGSMPDGSSVVPDEPDAAAFSCATEDASFCTSFDTGAIATGWNGLTYDGNGAAGGDTSRFRTPPQSALFERDAAAARAGAFLFQNFPTPFSSAHIAYELWVEDPGTGEFDFGQVGLGPTAAYVLEFGFRGGAPTIFEYGTGTPSVSTSHPISRAPKTGGWTHVDIVLSFGGGGPSPISSSVSIAFDYTPVASGCRARLTLPS
jgi:hypothetical protein